MNETEPDREPAPRSTITLMGNTYDLAALVALITGAVVLFMIVTCGMGAYCLPFVPIVAGIIALASAARAADPQRTRLYAWLGVGAGGLTLLLTVGLILLYVGLLVAMGLFAGPQ